jgi:hypothetical protein
MCIQEQKDTTKTAFIGRRKLQKKHETGCAQGNAAPEQNKGPTKNPAPVAVLKIDPKGQSHSPSVAKDQQKMRQKVPHTTKAKGHFPEKSA